MSHKEAPLTIDVMLKEKLGRRTDWVRGSVGPEFAMGVLAKERDQFGWNGTL